MKKIILEIEGMTCSACSNGLERYLKKQKGIQTVSVNLVMANASVEYDETILEQKQIEEFIKEAGFESKGLFKEIKIEEKSKKEKEITTAAYQRVPLCIILHLKNTRGPHLHLKRKKYI